MKINLFTVGMLAALCLVLAGCGNKEEKEQALCGKHIRRIGMAMVKFSFQHNTQAPKTLDELYQEGALDEEDRKANVTCCGDGTTEYTFTSVGKLYGSGSKTKVLVSCPKHGIRLFADGHVEYPAGTPVK